MARPVNLIGGRYDGFVFGSADGWAPSDGDDVLVLGRPAADEWRRAVEALASPAVPTTTLVAVPYKALSIGPSGWSPYDPAYHAQEVYLRRADGNYGVPGLARCR